MNILSMTFEDLVNHMVIHYGKGKYHAVILYREIFKKGNISLQNIKESDISPILLHKITDEIVLPDTQIISQHKDTVLKFASQLCDKTIIESVIIPFANRTTLCVSSQAGCRMRCAFCATGAQGFTRNLSAEEIVQQIFTAQFNFNYHIDNIVFMGMGEPLDNFDNVAQAIRVISDQRGFNIALCHITVSTAGHAEGIRRLTTANLPKVRLAVSVNAANNDLRNTLMPINRKYPLEELKSALMATLTKNETVFVEYILIAGVNDSYDNALQLIHYLQGLNVRINIIPYNSNSFSPFNSPVKEQVDKFVSWLTKEKLFVRIRRSFGEGIDAACGQLRASLKD